MDAGWEIPARHSFVRGSYEAAGSEGRFRVTFECMRRGYGQDGVFFDVMAVALAVGGFEGAGR